MKRIAHGICPKCGSAAVRPATRENYMECLRTSCEHVAPRARFIAQAVARGGAGSAERTARDSIDEEGSHFVEHHVRRPYDDPFDPRDEDR